MNINIDEVEFTIFDTETTGLEPESGDRIIEIAGIRFKGEQTLATFQDLINPHRPVSNAAFEVNKITPDMLKDAADAKEIIPKFLDFIKGSYLCSYNAPFDIGFLNNELKIMGKPLLENIVIIDILKMARRLLPGLEHYSLMFVADRLGIKIQQKHRAFSDVELTLAAFNKLRETLKIKGISNFLNFSSLFGLNSEFLSDINNQKIAKIQEAMELGVKLKIKYLSRSRAEVTEREVIPKEIRQDKGYTYLVGYCCLRNEERSFRVDGILHLEIV